MSGISMPGPRLRRVLFFVLVAGTAAHGVVMMLRILRANGMTPLEWSILALFAVTFAWITVAFWTAAAGFVLELFGRDPLTLRRRRQRVPGPNGGLHSRTAVVMPVYNEEPGRVMAGFEATCLSLLSLGVGRHFDFYLLSDTNDTDIAVAERAHWRAMCRRLEEAESQLFYRRRTDNAGRKAGNIAEFCTRWGQYYDHMIVLDADSVMTGDALVSLVRAMEMNPDAGIIQTVPIPVRQRTPFGRFVQFAARLYSPMLAAGLSFWQMETANFWGHNAILRVDAFTECCGLPTLPGRPPLGGEILSHDFVEAALIRRGGWRVYVMPEITGSFEEVPSNILDYAKRDRRWTQGNLQHLKLLGMHGLHPISRLHFLLGAVAFLSSLFWLLMLGVSTADAVGRALSKADFFGAGYQLFPDWPVAMTEEIVSLLVLTIAMLLLPKLWGILLALLRRDERRGFGGARRLLESALVELVFSVLLAPVMMTFHAYFVISVLTGHNISWGPQAREGRKVPYLEAIRRTWLAMLIGIGWGVGTYLVAPMFFWWLTPILGGLVLAAPLIVWSSRLDLGRWLAAQGLWLTPEETTPPAVLAAVELYSRLPASASPASSRDSEPPVLPDRPVAMPAQSRTAGPHWRRGWPRGVKSPLSGPSG